MNNLSTELKTHRVFIKNEEPVLISSSEFERIIDAINKKSEYVKIGDNKIIKRYFVDKIEPISKEEFKTKVKYDQEAEKRKWNLEWKKQFDLDCFKFLEMSKEEREKYKINNKYKAFQFEFYEKNPNSTLKEQNEALIKFIKESKSRITPSFLKK